MWPLKRTFLALYFISTFAVGRACKTVIISSFQDVPRVGPGSLSFDWPQGTQLQEMCFPHACSNNPGFVRRLTYDVPFLDAGKEMSIPAGLGIGDEFGKYKIAGIDPVKIILTSPEGGRISVPYDKTKGKIVQAYQFEAKVNKGWGRKHTIKFYAERFPVPVWGKTTPQEKLQSIATEILSVIPMEHVGAIQSIELLGGQPHAEGVAFAPGYENKGVLATAGPGSIRYYDFRGNAPKADTTEHEFFHNLMYAMFGSYMPPASYIQAAEKSGVSVSHYGDAGGPVEDVAEAGQLWLEAMRSGFSPEVLSLQGKHHERFSHIENWFNDHPRTRARRNVLRYFMSLGFLITVTATGSICIASGNETFPTPLKQKMPDYCVTFQDNEDTPTQATR